MTYNSGFEKHRRCSLIMKYQVESGSRIIKMYFDLCCKKSVMHFVIVLNNVFWGFKVI